MDATSSRIHHISGWSWQADASAESYRDVNRRNLIVSQTSRLALLAACPRYCSAHFQKTSPWEKRAGTEFRNQHLVSLFYAGPLNQRIIENSVKYAC